MTESVLQKEKRCLICGKTYPLHRHHVLPGTAMRARSEAAGLVIWLCPHHHDLMHQNGELMRRTKQWAQATYEKSHSREEWMQVALKNYLLEEEDENLSHQSDEQKKHY